MKKHLLFVSFLSLMMFGLLSAPSQADFFQCPDIGCGGGENSVNADLINGSPTDDNIIGNDGNDAIFGGPGNDSLFGGADRDFIAGGLNNDFAGGDEGNDVLWVGPDTDANSEQFIDMGPGNDHAFVLASEILGCLTIDDFSNQGQDVVSLIGFGPYVAVQPFGQPGFGTGYVQVFDPIAGGQIVIRVDETGSGGINVINGLPSPNVTILDGVPDGCAAD